MTRRRTLARAATTGSRSVAAVSVACIAVGLGLVGTALADDGAAPVQPPRTSPDIGAAPYTPPGEPTSDAGAGSALEDDEAATSQTADANRASKADVMPTNALAPEVNIPGLVRIPAPPEPEAQSESVEVVAEPTRLRVPAIGVDTTLLHLGLNEDGTLEVPPRSGPDNLKASWYDGSPRAGQVGPTVIAGHIDSKQGPSVFYRLGELDPGDEILIDRADETTATFVVDGSERYPKDDFPTRRVYGRTDNPQIRLITCGGLFDRSTGHYKDNTVVYGHLVDG